MAGAAFGGEVRRHETLSSEAWNLPRKIIPFSQKTLESLLQRNIFAGSVSLVANGRVLSHVKRSHTLFNLNVPYCVRQKAPPLVPVLRHLNPILTFCSKHFTSVLQFAPRHTFSFCSIGGCHMRRFSCPVIWSHLERSTNHVASERGIFSILLIFPFSYVHRSSSALCVVTPSACFSLVMRDQVSHPYRTAAKMIIS
jgi:hypothetical protein